MKYCVLFLFLLFDVIYPVHEVIEAPYEPTREYETTLVLHWFDCWFILDNFQTGTWVMPKLSQSKVAFKDITWDPVSKQVRLNFGH